MTQCPRAWSSTCSRRSPSIRPTAIARPQGLSSNPARSSRMPLGARLATGVVWSMRPGGGDNLKPIEEVLDWPPLRQPLRDFIDWAARWTLAPRGMLLAHGDPRQRNRRAASTQIRPRRHRQNARAHDRSAGARARGAGRGRRAGAEDGARGARSVLGERHRRPCRRRRARGGRARAGAERRAARPRFPAIAPQPRPARRSRRSHARASPSARSRRPCSRA